MAAIIVEQIDRASVLKQKTFPISYPEIAGLAERIGRMLDDQIVSLKTLEKELNNTNEGQIGDIFGGVRISIRQISLLESYGVSPLYYQSQDMKFLNKLF